MTMRIPRLSCLTDWAWIAVLVCLAAEAQAEQRISRRPFGKAPDGTPVSLYTLTNSQGMEASITDYGGIVVTLLVPDREGKLDDVVLGYDSFDGYLANNPYFGALIGRYGNRIGGAKFTLDGQEYRLAANNHGNHLHGGLRGFDKVVWKSLGAISERGPRLVLNYLSADGEEGYPGNLAVTVTYVLTEANELAIHYEAKTDKPTPVNLTHHSYFNLAGEAGTDILGHVLLINADRFTPVGEGLIPTGEIRPVKGSPMDFLEPTPIGQRIDHDDPQLKLGLGYDHNWVLSKPAGELGLAAVVYEPTSGRVMEVLTTEPGLQFYSGNFLNGTITGKKGKVYKHRYGFCLETQHFPDSPNKPNFPSTILQPGARYTSTTIYRFSTKSPAEAPR